MDSPPNRRSSAGGGGEAEAFNGIGFLDVPEEVQFTKLAALRYPTCGRTVGGEIIWSGGGRFSEEPSPSSLDEPAEPQREAIEPEDVTPA